MAISNVTSSDSILNAYLGIIRSAYTGRDARSAMADAVNRCYVCAVQKAGGAKNGVTRSVINVHIDRIRNAVFGEEVRDALKTGLTLCYSARDKSVPSAETTYFNNLITAQTGEDLKNGILNSIAKCCRDVMT